MQASCLGGHSIDTITKPHRAQCSHRRHNKSKSFPVLGEKGSGDIASVHKG